VFRFQGSGEIGHKRLKGHRRESAGAGLLAGAGGPFGRAQGECSDVQEAEFAGGLFEVVDGADRLGFGGAVVVGQ